MEEIDIMKYLRQDMDISGILKNIIKDKPKEHNLEDIFFDATKGGE